MTVYLSRHQPAGLSPQGDKPVTNYCPRKLFGMISYAPTSANYTVHRRNQTHIKIADEIPSPYILSSSFGDKFKAPYRLPLQVLRWAGFAGKNYCLNIAADCRYLSVFPSPSNFLR
jgi:hypothetical protein